MNKCIVGSRLHRLVLAFILVINFAVIYAIATPEEASAAPNPCDVFPDPTARKFCTAGLKAAIGTAHPGIGVIIAADSIPGIPGPSDAIGAAAGFLVEPILEQVAKAEARAVTYSLQKMVRFIAASTTPDLMSVWFIDLYRLFFAFAFLVGLLLMWFRMGGAAWAENFTEIGKAGSGFLAFFLAGTLLPGLLAGIVKVLDGSVAPAIIGQSGDQVETLLSGMEVDVSSPGSGIVVPILVPALVLFFGAIGGIVVEFMLIFRMYALYVVAVFEIVAIAFVVGGRWTAARFHKTTLILIALLFFPVYLSTVLYIGVKLLASDAGAEPFMMGAVVCIAVPAISLMIFREISNHHTTIMNRSWDYAKRGYQRARPT